MSTIYLLLYCSSAGMGLTRDSDLQVLPASNNLVPTNMKLCGLDLRSDLAFHGFAAVGLQGTTIWCLLKL